MAAITFIAGIVLTLGFDELGLVRRRDPSNGRYRPRDRPLGLVLLFIAVAMVAVVMIWGKQ